MAFNQPARLDPEESYYLLWPRAVIRRQSALVPLLLRSLRGKADQHHSIQGRRLKLLSVSPFQASTSRGSSHMPRAESIHYERTLIARTWSEAFSCGPQGSQDPAVQHAGPAPQGIEEGAAGANERFRT